MSNAARNWITENLIEGRVAGEMLESLVEASVERNVFGHFHYLYQIDIEVDGRLLNVGWRGGLKPGALLDVAGWVRLFTDA